MNARHALTFPSHTDQTTPNRLEDGFPLTAAQPTNITEKTTCYSYVGVAPKRKVSWSGVESMYPLPSCLLSPTH